MSIARRGLIASSFPVAVSGLPNRSLDSTDGDNYLSMGVGDFTSGFTLDRKKFAISIWIKPELLLIPRGFYNLHGTTTATSTFSCEIRTNLELKAYIGSTTYYVNGNTAINTSSWQHCLFIWDSAQATEADRMQIYLNGSRETISASSLPAQNAEANTPTSGVKINSGPSLSYDGLSYQPAFFNGSIPAIGDLYDGGSPKDLTAVTGLESLLRTNDTDALEDDYVLATNFTNTNSVIKSTDIPT